MSKRKNIRFTAESPQVDSHTAEKAGNFLFDLGREPEDDDLKPLFWSAALSAKTRVKGPKTMAALSYYDVLAQGFGSKAARVVGDALKRLLIADKGLGRVEAKEVIKGSLPEEIEIPVGHE